MNFIDIALEQNLSGDEFLQAMADIFNEPQVYDILHQYPIFIKDVILIIDYDTTIQMEGLEDIVGGSLSGKCEYIIDALNRSGNHEEADILREAKDLYDKNESQFAVSYNQLQQRMALNNNYDEFWDNVREYIDENLGKKSS